MSFTDYYYLMDQTLEESIIELNLNDINTFLDDKMFICVHGKDNYNLIKEYIDLPIILDDDVKRLSYKRSYCYITENCENIPAILKNFKKKEYTIALLCDEELSIKDKKNVIDFILKKP